MENESVKHLFLGRLQTKGLFVILILQAYTEEKKNMNKITLLLLGIIMISSCEKEEEIDITDVTGDTTTQTVCLPTVSNLTETAVSSYTAPDGNIYTTSGTYEVVIPNAAGCDSTIIINLTINQLAVIGEYRDGGIVFWEDGKGGGFVCAINDQRSA